MRVKLKLPKIVLLSLLCLVLAIPPCVAAEWDKWMAQGTIDVTGNEKYKALFLSEEVYEYAQTDLRDLRIIDQDNQALPYIIERGHQTSEILRETYQSRLSYTYREDDDDFFDFQVLPRREGQDIIINQLQLGVISGNFHKHIDVYGSHDGKQWTFLLSDELYLIDGLAKDFIELKNNYLYNYYRLQVKNNIDNISLYGLQGVAFELKEDWRNFEERKSVEYELKEEGSQTVITIQNPGHLKFAKIELELEGNFKRDYKVYEVVSDDRELLHTKGAIFSLNFADSDVSNNVINLRNDPIASTLVIRIENHDNSPLKIGEILGTYYLDKIVFEDVGSASYRLLFGNPLALAPRYDWEDFRTEILKETHDLVTLSSIKEGVAVEQNTKNLKWILNGVVLVTALVLVLFLVQKLDLKKTKTS